MKSLVWIRYEIKSMLADFKVAGLLLMAPLFLLFLFGYALSPYLVEESSFEKIDLALVNLDDSMETRILIQHFVDHQELQQLIRLEQVDEEGAYRLLEENKVSAAILVPDGFSRDLERGINTPVTVLGNHQRPLQAALVRTLMESSADIISASQSGVNTIYIYMERANVSKEELQSILQQTVLQFVLQSLNRQEVLDKRMISAYGEVGMKQYYLVNIGILFVLCIGLLGVRLGTADSILLEQRLRSLGIGSFNLLIVRWLTLAVFITVPFLFYFGLLGWMMKEVFQGQLGYVLLISLIFPLSVSALFTTVSTCCRNMATINVVSFVLIIGMSLVGGTIIPLAYLPSWVESIYFLSLNRWLSQGILIALFGGEGKSFWFSMLVLSLVITFLFSLAIALQRRRRGE